MLVGPNGAGKSTLLKVLLGLVSSSTGTLCLDGVVQGNHRYLKESLGYLPENVAFSEMLTGAQVLSFFAHARNISKARCKEVLEQVGLSHASGRLVRGYSRGMRQRLGLAIAILTKPSLLVLDEPTGGLDQEGLSVLWDVLSSWRAAGKMVLLSTHDIALLERRVDHVCVLQAGKIRAQGSPTSLRNEVGLPVKVSLSFLSEKGLKKASSHKVLQPWIFLEETTTTSLCLHIPPVELVSFVKQQPFFSEDLCHLRIEEPTLDEVYEKILEGKP